MATCSCEAYFSQPGADPVGLRWNENCPEHGRTSSWFRARSRVDGRVVLPTLPLAPSRGPAKPRFVVSHPAQHEFRVLGGERPNGSAALAQAAWDKAGQARARRVGKTPG